MKQFIKDWQYMVDRGVSIFFDRAVGTFGEVAGALGAYWCFQKIRDHKRQNEIKSGDKVKIGFQIRDE